MLPAYSPRPYSKIVINRGVFVATTYNPVVEHEDQIHTLKEQGIDTVFNHYSEAGVGFAEHVLEVREGLTAAKGQSRSS